MAGEGRAKYYHARPHKRLMGEVEYLRWPLDVKGAYDYLYNLAGSTNNQGSLKIGGHERLTFEQVVALLAEIPKTTVYRAGRIVERLLFDGYLAAYRGDEKVKPQDPADRELYRGATIILTYYVRDQEECYTRGAIRQRNHRAGKFFGSNLEIDEGAFGEFANETEFSGVTGHVESDLRPKTIDTRVSLIPEPSGLPAGSPPPPQAFRSGSGSGGQVRSGGQNQNPDLESDLEKEREQDGGAEEAAAGSGSGSEGGGGEPAGSGAFADDPVTAYCKAVGEFSPLARNTAAKHLRDLAIARGGNRNAEDIYRNALNELRQLEREGRIPRLCRDQTPMTKSRYFTGIYRRHLAGNP